LAEVEVEGVRLDLHQQMRLVGLTYGVEPTSATLGWAVTEEMTIVRGGQLVPVSGLALHFIGLTRFEVAFDQESPGQLDYFELRRDPDPSLRFFFEGGTIRIAAEGCRAELVLGGEEDDGGDEAAASGSGLVQ
jgi:hypothetical protein